MSELSALSEFSQNTKKICIITTIAFLIIIITMIAPLNINRFASFFCILLSIVMLIYSIVINCKETNKLISNISFFEDIGPRNNALLSYVFSLSIAILILYIIFTFIY